MKKINTCLVSFWLLIILAFSLIFITIKKYPYDQQVIGYNYPLESIVTNVELDKKYEPSSFLICHNDYCESPKSDFFYNVYYTNFNSETKGFLEAGKIKNIYILYQDKNFINDIKIINSHVGNKGYYYTKDDIQKFEKKELSLKLDESGDVKKYYALSLPEINNYKGILRHLTIMFLSLIHSNWMFYVFAYCMLFAAFLIYALNKDKFNFKFELDNKKTYIILGLIIALGAFIRFIDITYYPLWTDEIYTKGVAIQNFKTCFEDPGNPPMFFILEYLFTRIFSVSDFTIRFLPCIFGILFIPMVFVLFKEICGKKIGLFAAFVAAVNMFNISHSQEARAYSLDMLLAVASIYLLFNYLKNTNIKNLIFYGIITAIMVNTHYYLILLSITNFIWGVVCLLEEKKTQEIKNFFLANFIAALTFIPYLVISAKAALSPEFNGWIEKLSKQTFVEMMHTYFIDKNIFIMLASMVMMNLIYCFLPSSDKDKKKEEFYIYLIYTLVLIFILASAISILIKPMLQQRIILSIYGVFFCCAVMTIVSVINADRTNKVFFSLKSLYTFVLTLVMLSVTNLIPIKEHCNLYDFMEFIKNDIKQYPGYEIHVVTCDVKEYLNGYPEMQKIKNINWHFIYTNGGEIVTNIKKDDYTDKEHKVIVYFNAIGVDISRFVPLNNHAYTHRSNLHNNTIKLVYD